MSQLEGQALSLPSLRVVSQPSARRPGTVWHPGRPRGGQPLPALHCEPQATSGVHRQAAVLPAGQGVQHQPVPAGGEPLGLQRHQ